MGQLLRDLEYFRKEFKTYLEYDSGAGNYLEETGDGTEYDIRSCMDAGDGTIKEETIVDYSGYRIAMDNFQMGFDKTKDQIEKIWKDVDVGEGSLATARREVARLQHKSDNVCLGERCFRSGNWM